MSEPAQRGVNERRAPAPFGAALTPSMMAASYTPGRGWGEPELTERASLPLDPAVMALHYGQAAFEGLRAHRQANGSWALFRAREHAERLARSCRRMAIPQIEPERLMEWWRAFVRYEIDRLPADHAVDLYLRPLVFGCDPILVNRPSSCYTYLLLGVIVERDAVPTRRMEVLINDQFVRSVPGGLGSAKVPGNYGAGMLARKTALDHGCDDVLWLDAGRRRWIEELGSMNVAFLIADVLVTPILSDTIVDGVTRATVLTLARELGIECEERPIALEELTAAIAWNGLTEAMGCGTAAGIATIGALHVGEKRLPLPDANPVADQLREQLHAHQHGQVIDSRGWLTPV